MDKILQWQHDRAGKVTLARGLLDTAEKDGRNLTADEEKRYADLISEADSIQGRIDREKELQQREAQMLQPDRRGVRPVPMADPNIGMNPQEIRQYSLVKAINAAATGDWRNARLELEASEAVAKRMGITPQGLFVPYDWMAGEQRDVVKGTATAGGHTVATNLLAQNFIDLLRNRMVLQQAGITVLSGLVGDVAIPRQTGGATAYWVAESGAPTESLQAFDQVTMNPKTLGAFTDMSRRLLKQSSLDVEAFVRTDLATIAGLEIDRAGLHGLGSSNQPTGIAATAGIGSVAGGTNGLAPTRTHLVGLETAVAQDNADVGNLAYVTNTRVRGKLKLTEVASSTGIWTWQDGPTPLNGYRALVSNQVSSALTKGTSTGVCSGIFFGNWRDLLMGMWGGLDLLVDPYTVSTTGTVRVVVLQDVDIAVRQPASFSAMLDALTT
jgi:HK97 family phage major capsid protein